MHLRRYDPERDKEPVRRIWREVGWLKEGKEEACDLMFGCGLSYVADMEGQPECAVATAMGGVRHLDEDLPLTVLTSVATSRIARKQGLPRRLMARALAENAEAGVLVAGLGMFEQGYYNQVGFGTGAYEHWVSFDPATLKVTAKHRVPKRITADDWQAAHTPRLSRLGGHGRSYLTPAEMTRAEMLLTDNGFGLGYGDAPHGGLSHYLWFGAENLERGPYEVGWMAYQTWDQFLELMALVRSLGDQVHLVAMREPPFIQMQDLVDKPFKHREITEKSKFEVGIWSDAYWQMRILDLPGCLARTRLPCGDLRFNLRLTDPVERYLDGDSPPSTTWRGVGGEYLVALGPASRAERGSDPSLPTLTATVNSFTRLWLGVRPATGLAVTDELRGPADLLAALDRAFCLPTPRPDWSF
jgi:GNAT superfamily N-acetyltransferase